MLATKRGLALVRRATPQPANDNVPSPPGDGPFFPALALICAAIIGLLAWVALKAPDPVIAALWR